MARAPAAVARALAAGGGSGAGGAGGGKKHKRVRSRKSVFGHSFKANGAGELTQQGGQGDFQDLLEGFRKASIDKSSEHKQEVARLRAELDAVRRELASEQQRVASFEEESMP